MANKNTGITIEILYKNYLENFHEGCFSRKRLKYTKKYDGFFEEEIYEVFTQEEFKNLLENNREFNKHWGLPQN